MSNIVERLRAVTLDIPRMNNEGVVSATLAKEAAAEIERLRAALVLIASGGTKYDSAADLIRIAMRALEPKP